MVSGRAKTIEKLTIGIIGAWGHGGNVLAALEEVPDEIEVVGLAGVLPEDKPRDLQAKFKISARARVFENPARLLAEARPRAVIISTRLDQIAPQAMAAARAGCHLICEKPLALRPADLRALYTVVQGAGVQCVAILSNCAHPVLRAARRAIQAGLIGDVVLCNARKSYKFGADRPAWFGRRDLYGGTIPWLGIHAFDFIESASGLRCTAVAAMQGNIAHPEYPDCEDHGALILRLDNGGHATVSLDFLRPDGAPGHGDDWLRVVGSRGVIEAYLARNTCTLMTASQAPLELPLPAPVNFFADLARKLRDDPASLAEDTLRSFRLTHACLCARDAADRQEVVPIPAW